MAEINWGLLDIPDIGGNALAAFHQGRQIREQKDTKAAWSAYAANPDDPNALNALAQYDPKSAIALRQDSEKRRREMQAQDLQRKAVAGDPAALAQLSGIDLDAWSKVDSRQKAQIKEQASYIGNAALAISRLPPQQQAQAWDQAAQQGAQMYPELAQQVGKFSPQGLQAALANANMISKFIDVTTPDTINLQAGAGLYERDPVTRQIREVIRPNPGGARPLSPVEGAPAVPSEAISDLRRNPGSAAQFDEIFGPGAAARALGGAASNGSGGFLATPPQRLASGAMTSGRRTPEGNAAVGGVPDSWHVDGNAVDYDGPDLGRLLSEARQKFPGAKAFIHDGHVHVQDRRLNAPYYGKNGTKGLK